MSGLTSMYSYPVEPPKYPSSSEPPFSASRSSLTVKEAQEECVFFRTIATDMFLKALEMMRELRSDGYLEGLQRELSFLLIVAVPDTPAAAEKFAEKFYNMMQILEKSHSKLFSLCTVCPPHNFFILGLLYTAFLARRLEGERLFIDGKELGLKEISKPSKQCEHFFSDVLKMKSAMGNLELSPDDHLAWTTLVELLERFAKEDLSSLSGTGKNSLRCLMETSLVLGSEIAFNKMLKDAWDKVLYEKLDIYRGLSPFRDIGSID